MSRRTFSLAEDMSFRQLMNYSDPKRVVRSLTVHGPPLDIRAFEDSMYYLFNFKSSPSMTGLRHKGYIKFLKPDKRKPLMDVKCVVDCTCPDFRYRWAWADKQRHASKVGPGSMNQALNRAPHITNPSARPGMCKHLLALRNWLDNSLDVLTSETEDDGSALKRLVAYAQHRHQNEPDIMAAAKAKDYKSLLAMLRKREGKPGALDKAAGKIPGKDDAIKPEATSADIIKPTGPGTEPPLVSPTNSPNPLDFHGRLPKSTEPGEEPGEDKKGKRRTVDSLETNTTMNLIEAQQKIREMIDASPVNQPQVGATAANSNCNAGCMTAAPGEGEDVSPESEALNLLRNINAGIQELLPAVQAMSQGGDLAGPGDMDGIDFPEPGGEGEGGLDLGDESDRLDTGGESSAGSFGDMTGGPDAFGGGEGEGSASREAEGGKASRGREGKGGSASREREGKRKNLSVGGKED